MKSTLVFRRIARLEYDHAIDWYEDREPGLGFRFEAAVEAVLDHIAEQPDFYPVARRDVRHALIYPFPYCVYYRVRKNLVVVVSVFHESRDPKEWQSRA